MINQFIPLKEALELKQLGFDEKCLTSYASDGVLISVWNIGSEPAIIMKDEPDEMYIINSVNFKNSYWCAAPLYQQAFRWFREKYDFRYSIGNTNICVYHIPVSNYHTTFMLQDCESYEDAELQCIKAFIEHAKQL